LTPFKTTLYLKHIQTTFTTTTFIYKLHAFIKMSIPTSNPIHMQTTKFKKKKHTQTNIMI